MYSPLPKDPSSLHVSYYSLVYVTEYFNKWNHTVYIPSYLASSTEHNYFETHTCCSMCQ